MHYAPTAYTWTVKKFQDFCLFKVDLPVSWLNLPQSTALCICMHLFQWSCQEKKHLLQGLSKSLHLSIAFVWRCSTLWNQVSFIVFLSCVNWKWNGVWSIEFEEVCEQQNVVSSKILFVVTDQWHQLSCCNFLNPFITGIVNLTLVFDLY